MSIVLLSIKVFQITQVLAEQQVNISDMLNQHRGDIAYTIIDLDDEIQDTQIQKLREIEGVSLVRYHRSISV